MNDLDKVQNGNLVPAARRDIAIFAAANPLVSRGVSDLVKMSRAVQAENPPPDDFLESAKKLSYALAKKAGPLEVWQATVYRALVRELYQRGRDEGP